jgi:hypothetical protein
MDAVLIAAKSIAVAIDRAPLAAESFNAGRLRTFA